jgi:hypothetical protein
MITGKGELVNISKSSCSCLTFPIMVGVPSTYSISADTSLLFIGKFGAIIT